MGGAVAAAAAGRTLARAFTSERVKSDHIQNINRLYRLPGTVNVLSDAKRALGREPALAYVVEADYPLGEPALRRA